MSCEKPFTFVMNDGRESYVNKKTHDYHACLRFWRGASSLIDVWLCGVLISLDSFSWLWPRWSLGSLFFVKLGSCQRRSTLLHAMSRRKVQRGLDSFGTPWWESACRPMGISARGVISILTDSQRLDSARILKCPFAQGTSFHLSLMISCAGRR